jgi:hypothetical protein
VGFGRRSAPSCVATDDHSKTISSLLLSRQSDLRVICLFQISMAFTQERTRVVRGNEHETPKTLTRAVFGALCANQVQKFLIKLNREHNNNQKPDNADFHQKLALKP